MKVHAQIYTIITPTAEFGFTGSYKNENLNSFIKAGEMKIMK